MYPDNVAKCRAHFAPPPREGRLATTLPRAPPSARRAAVWRARARQFCWRAASNTHVLRGAPPFCAWNARARAQRASWCGYHTATTLGLGRALRALRGTVSALARTARARRRAFMVACNAPGAVVYALARPAGAGRHTSAPPRCAFFAMSTHIRVRTPATAQRSSVQAHPRPGTRMVSPLRPGCMHSKDAPAAAVPAATLSRSRCVLPPFVQLAAPGRRQRICARRRSAHLMRCP